MAPSLSITRMLALWLLVTGCGWVHGAGRMLLAKDGGHGTGRDKRLLQSSAGVIEVLVRDSSSFWSALANEGIGTVLLNASLVLNTTPPGGTIALKRNVSIQATPELLRVKTKVYVDFKSQNMVVSIEPGYTLRFVGLELANMFGLVGSQLTIVRQSPGSRVEFVDCVRRRRVGLPTDAALVNMLSAARGDGVSGSQQVYKLSNYTFNTTRSPGAPVQFTNDVVLQLDYVVNVAADSSLAFQGLYFGGYAYAVIDSVYHPDNIVAQSCLDSRPGDECVSDYLRQLDAQEAAAAQAAAAPSDSGGLSTTDTIVVAVVVPMGVVLLAAVAAAVVLARRRRARAAAYAKGVSATTNEAGGSESKAGAGPSTTARSSDIFMGFEAGAAPPEWTQQHEEEAAADFATANHGEDPDSWDAAPAANDDHAAHTAGAANGTAANAEAAAPPGSAAPDRQTSARGRISRKPTGGLRPAFAAAQWRPNAAPGPQSGMGLVSSTAGSGVGATPASAAVTRPTAGSGAAYVSNGAAANGNGSHATEQQAEPGAQQPASTAAASAGLSNGAAPASVAADESVTVQPAEAPRPTDVAAELAQMARQVRMQVKDVAIRIDTVLGTGAFGVVYGGIWQGIPVAVKTVVISASQERRKRALQEAALCQSIVHPNIIATYACELQPIGAPVTSVSSSDAATTDSGRTGLAAILPQIVDWRLYIIQELADGGPLSKLYGRPDIWPAPSAPHMVPVVALALGIARALTHLHAKRIIHGDLSPNNVLLKKDANEPSGYVTKVGDFGLSVMLPQHQSHLSNLRMGTMFYMCPAVIIKGQVGPASDVFSLGVILWELYHGRRAGVRTKEGPRYASIFPAFPPSCPRAYVNITLNCLQRDPVNRPTSEVVADHLNALLQSLVAEP